MDKLKSFFFSVFLESNAIELPLVAKFYAYGLMALSVRWEVSEPHWKHQILNGSLEIPLIIPIIIVIAITTIIIIPHHQGDMSNLY